MNTDYRITIGFFRHHKTKRLQKRLGSDGILALLKLWEYTAEFRPNGDLSGLSDEDIELSIDWISEKPLIAYLAEIGFVDGTEGDRVIHEWKSHNPWACVDEARSASGRLARLFQKNPVAAKSFQEQGRTGITKTEYMEATAGRPQGDRHKNTGEPQGDRRAVRQNSSAPVPVPVPVPVPAPSAVCSVVHQHPPRAQAREESGTTHTTEGEPGHAVQDPTPTDPLESSQEGNLIPADWTPQSKTRQALASLAIPDEFIEACIPHFHLYHTETGTRRRRGFESLFVGWVKIDWEKAKARGLPPTKADTATSESHYRNRQEAKMTVIEWEQYLIRRYDRENPAVREPLMLEDRRHAH